MTNLLRIRAWDTFAYQYLDFTFTKGIHSIVGPNGASKSSLWMTLFQGFFNRNPKGLKIEEVNNCITHEPYEIQIDFERDGAQYLLINSRKSGKIEILKNGKKVHLKRIPENLKLIEEIIGADYATALDLLYQSRESTINLLETSTDGQRKKFINRILRLDELDSHLERMKAKEKEIGGKRGRTELLQQQIEALESSLGVLLEEEEEIDVSAIITRQALLHKEHKRALKDYYGLERDQVELQGEITKYEDHESALATIAKLEEELGELELPGEGVESLEAEKQELEKNYAEFKYEGMELKGVINRYDAKQRDRDRVLLLDQERRNIDLPAKTQGEIEAVIEKLRQADMYCGTNIIRLQKELEAFRKAAAEGICPTCQRSLAEGNLDDEIGDRETELKKFQEKRGGVEERHQEYQKLLGRYNLWNRLTAEIEKYKVTPENEIDIVNVRLRYDLVEESIAEFKDKLDQCNADISQHRKYTKLESELNRLRAEVGPGVDIAKLRSRYIELDRKLKKLSEQIQVMNCSLNENECSLSENNEKNAHIRARKELNRQTRENNAKIMLQLDGTRKELQETEERLELIKTWVGILGSKGFRVNKMNRFLKHLNVSMKKYSEMICGGRIQCQFFTNDDGEVDFRITDANKTISYAGWSGGEKARVKLACLFAVLELLEVIGSVSFNVLALDEIFDSLDGEGKEGLFKVLTYIQNKGKCIYTIAHSELALDKTFDSFIKAEQHPDGICTLTQ